MSDRRLVPDRDRRLPAGEQLCIVQHHKQSHAGPRELGWLIAREGARREFVLIDEDGRFAWTPTRRDAAMFFTRAAADIWAARHLERSSIGVAA